LETFGPSFRAPFETSRQLAASKFVLRWKVAKPELDKTIIEAIKDPLTHIMRNAVDHGMERPEVRRAAGKPVEGKILLPHTAKTAR
jgi:hypothetical protein